jgi:hypothetical protein
MRVTQINGLMRDFAAQGNQPPKRGQFDLFEHDWQPLDLIYLNGDTSSTVTT